MPGPMRRKAHTGAIESCRVGFGLDSRGPGAVIPGDGMGDAINDVSEINIGRHYGRGTLRAFGIRLSRFDGLPPEFFAVRDRPSGSLYARLAPVSVNARWSAAFMPLRCRLEQGR